MRSLAIWSGAATLAVSAVIVVPPAAADEPLSSQQLTDVVPRVKDVRVFYKGVSSEIAPTAGTGADHIDTQGICIKPNGKYATLHNLAKRQAYSAQRIGPGEEGSGVISIVGQHKSVQQAKNKFNKVKQLLGSCPANVDKGSQDIQQGWRPLAKMYRGRALATTTVVTDSGDTDYVQYVAIRQTGAQLSFVRYAQRFEGPAPDSTQYEGMVEYLSGVVAQRYRSLS